MLETDPKRLVRVRRWERHNPAAHYRWRAIGEYPAWHLKCYPIWIWSPQAHFAVQPVHRCRIGLAVFGFQRVLILTIFESTRYKALKSRSQFNRVLAGTPERRDTILRRGFILACDVEFHFHGIITGRE